ncbi:MAG: glycosyltransferase family 2 protein [Thermoleophilia bacterium]
MRLVASLALLAGGAYVVWRAGWTLGGTSLWLSVPLLAAEAWAGLQLAFLALQAWRVPGPGRRVSPVGSSVGVLVLAGRSAVDEVERTLLGCRVLSGGPYPVTVADGSERPEIAAVAARLGAAYRVLPDELGARIESVEGELVLVLGAGQVPYPDLVARTSGRFADDRVACVQFRNDFANADALTTVFHGRNEQDLLNEVIGPSLGARGHALWLGAGSLVRRRAFLDAAAHDRGGAASRAFRMTARLLAAGWRVEFERAPMVESMGPDSLDAYLEGSRRRAYWTLKLLASRDNPLLARGVPWRARLTLFAAASRYLVGVQRLTLLLVLLATLASGRSPIDASLGQLAAVWLPAFALQAAAGVALARGTLAFGDRSRHALRTMGAYLEGTVRAFVLRAWRPRSVSGRGGGLRDISHLGLLAGLTLVLDGLLLVRAVGDRIGAGLPPLEGHLRVAALVAGVVVLVQMLDVLQLLLGRRQERRFYRCVDLAAWVGVGTARARDLTPRGSGWSWAIEVERLPLAQARARQAREGVAAPRAAEGRGRQPLRPAARDRPATAPPAPTGSCSASSWPTASRRASTR